jgi:hypothetical protein
MPICGAQNLLAANARSAQPGSEFFALSFRESLYVAKEHY